MSTAAARASTQVRNTALPSGEGVPVLGQGTWHFGEDLSRRDDEIASLHLGLDLGMKVIDTAEMYGDGAAEELLAVVLAKRRREVFLVSKVLPWNATRQGTIAACEGSLSRLGTDSIDLYLLHWRGPHPLEGTIAAFDALVQAGKIRYWGVSNFDLADMQELTSLSGGTNVTTDQVLYNLSRRGVEYDLVPWCRRRRVPIMAYSPIEQGRLLANPALRAVATRHGATPAQIALAWVLRDDGIIAIPKAGTPQHVRENRAALDVQLTQVDLGELDQAFPPPNGPRPLEMI
jgi:diketogulonate reductase-like aldo/keto reductase